MLHDTLSLTPAQSVWSNHESSQQILALCLGTPMTDTSCFRKGLASSKNVAQLLDDTVSEVVKFSLR